MKPLLYILAVPFTAIFGLAAFSSWWSALIYIGGLACLAFFAVRHHDKHQRFEAYDDRLTMQLVEKATEWLVQKGKKD